MGDITSGTGLLLVALAQSEAPEEVVQQAREAIGIDLKSFGLGFLAGVFIVGLLWIVKIVVSRSLAPAGDTPIVGADLSEVRAGGRIELADWRGEEVSFHVDKAVRAKSGNDEWIEFQTVLGGDDFRLQVEDDRGTEKVYALAPSSGVDLHALRTDEDALREMEKEDEGEVVLEGQVHQLDEVGEVKVQDLSKGREMPKACDAWRFLSHDRSGVILIEKWFDEPWEIFVGQRMGPGSVKVYDMGG